MLVLLIISVFYALFFYKDDNNLTNTQISVIETDYNKESLRFSSAEKKEEYKFNSHLVYNKDYEIKFLFFGDLMLDRNVGAKIKKNGLDALLHKLNEDKFTADYNFVMANLEGAVTNEGAHYLPDNLYDFAFAPEIIAKLKDYNFNTFTLANNHLSDQGQKGITETYQNLSALGYNYMGCEDAFLSDSNDFSVVDNNNLDENSEIIDFDNCSAVIMEKGNKKIGFLSFSIVYRAIDEDSILEKVKKLKEKSDIVVVSPHWGIEYESTARDSQVSLAHKMVDAGADMVIGHHPHVIQNYEVYKGKPIFYSLGNFIFDQYFSKETQEGLAVAVTVKEEKINMEVYMIKTKGSEIIEILKQ
ncbi:CapA family protein [Patescibacteria group bacterium]|nr:CapA family protein [Patescibacteria group bacterium]